MAKKDRQPSAMYLSSLVVVNIKCFGNEQLLDLKKKDGAISPWTLILGDNGIGKTTLLKCLALMAPVEEKNEALKAKFNIPLTHIAIKPLMDDWEDNSEFERLIRNSKTINSSITINYSNEIALKNKSKVSNEISFGMKFEKKHGELTLVESQLTGLKSFRPPNVYAYSANRHMALKNYDQSELKNPINNLFSLSGDLYDAEQVLPMLELAALKNNKKADNLLKKVKLILADILPGIESYEDIIINSPLNSNGSPNPTRVEVKSQFGSIPLFNLSLGYQTMLALTVDLALRMFWSNPESASPLEEPAIVLIDEIDLHLHPKWQRSVREKLTSHFKNTQFVCTAHSPFMAQDSEDENLCVIRLSGNEVQIENEPSIVQGWRIGQIITSDLFGVEGERSPEIEALINERRTILEKRTTSSKEKSRLKYLDEELNKLPVTENVDNQKMLNEIDNLAKLIKKPIK